MQTRLSKKHLATRQLETAIRLFLSGESHYSAVITLCGASRSILEQYQKRSGKKGLVDHIQEIHEVLYKAKEKFSKTANIVNLKLGYVAHKHLFEGDVDEIELNRGRCAYDSIVATIGDFKPVFGENNNWIGRFLSYSYNNWKTYEEAEEYWNLRANNSCKVSRFELAECQLKTALILMNEGYDRISVITLSGAADVILCKLIDIDNRINFTKILMNNEIKQNNSKTKISEFGKELNDILAINKLKHFDKTDFEFEEFDIDELALGAISKAMANLLILKGENNLVFQGIKAWIECNKHEDWVARNLKSAT